WCRAATLAGDERHPSAGVFCGPCRIMTGTMSRRAVALLVMLLVAGLAPASAIIGYCSRMPCCHHKTAQPLKGSAAVKVCCTPIACYDAPSVKLTGNASSAAFPAVRALESTAFVVRAPQRIAVMSASPPPTTHQRLAILSTLLI